MSQPVQTIYHQVLLDYALLEQILLHATSFEITAAAKVCTFWHELTERSKPLRRYLFRLQPPPQVPRHPLPDIGSKVIRLNKTDSKFWHFRTRASNGVIFVLRWGDDEVFMFAPASPNSHIIVLDKRYTRVATDGSLHQREPNFLWYDAAGRLVTRTVCKARATHNGNSLRSYLHEHHGDEFDEDRKTESRAASAQSEGFKQGGLRDEAYHGGLTGYPTIDMERADALRMLQTQRDAAVTLRSLQREFKHGTPANYRTQAGLSDALYKIEDAQSILFRTAFEPALTSATDDVFSTFELVEAIILGLPIDDFIMATQVCRYWREVIERSSAAQHLLAVLMPPNMPLKLCCGDRATTVPWMATADIACGMIIIVRKDNFEIFIFVHASLQLPMRVLPSKLKRVYCDPANLRAGIEWYDVRGELICSREFSLLEAVPPGGLDSLKRREGVIKCDRLKAYLNAFYWHQDLRALREDWLRAELINAPALRYGRDYDERQAVEALAEWKLRLAR